jgi:hypothetical protein
MLFELIAPYLPFGPLGCACVPEEEDCCEVSTTEERPRGLAFHELPEDCVFHILSFVDHQTLAQTAQLSISLARIANEGMLWQELLNKSIQRHPELKEKSGMTVRTLLVAHRTHTDWKSMFRRHALLLNAIQRQRNRDGYRCNEHQDGIFILLFYYALYLVLVAVFSAPSPVSWPIWFFMGGLGMWGTLRAFAFLLKSPIRYP